MICNIIVVVSVVEEQCACTGLLSVEIDIEVLVVIRCLNNRKVNRSILDSHISDNFGIYVHQLLCTREHFVVLFLFCLISRLIVYGISIVKLCKAVVLQTVAPEIKVIIRNKISAYYYSYDRYEEYYLSEDLEEAVTFFGEKSAEILSDGLFLLLFLLFRHCCRTFGHCAHGRRYRSAGHCAYRLHIFSYRRR